MERYITQAKNVELSDRISEGLLVTVRDATIKALKDPKDYEARANLMWAGSLSPVSYTHLDVYKRQQYAIEEFNNTIDFQAILNLKFLQRYLV